jgi:hypothetical protein
LRQVGVEAVVVVLRYRHIPDARNLDPDKRMVPLPLYEVGNCVVFFGPGACGIAYTASVGIG